MHLCFIFDREEVTSVHPFCDEGHNFPPTHTHTHMGGGQSRQREERGRHRKTETKTQR